MARRSSWPRTIAPCASRCSTASKACSPMRLSSRIINDTIVPLFKQGDFAGGINAGVDQMMKVVDGEPLPAPDRSWKSRRAARHAAEVPGVSALVLGLILRNFIGRAPAALVSGLGGAGMAWWLHTPIARGAASSASDSSSRCCSSGSAGRRVAGGRRRRARVSRHLARWRFWRRASVVASAAVRRRRWRLQRRRRQGRRRRRVRPLVVSP